VRRLVAIVISALAMTLGVVIGPVSADPGPAAEPVTPAVQELALGSLEAPAPDAEVQPGSTEPIPGLEATPALTLTQAGTPEFSAVGVTWTLDPAVIDIVMNLRVQDASGAWGPWTELGMDDAAAAPDPARVPAQQRGGSEPYWSGPSFGAELEVLTRSGAAPQDVQLVLIDPLESPADAIPAEPEIQDVADAAASMPPIYSRAQWGADESLMTWPPEYAGTIKPQPCTTPRTPMATRPRPFPGSFARSTSTTRSAVGGATSVTTSSPTDSAGSGRAAPVAWPAR